MNAIHLFSVVSGHGRPGTEDARVSIEVLDDLAAELARIFQVSCHVHEEPFPAGFAYEAVRGQYYSTAIVQRMQSLCSDEETRVLGVTGLDLYIPILTYVFGEAQLGGRCALVSLHRLREEFYGLPPNEQLLRERAVKECVHELGHVLGLRHCFDWRCVMASTHDVERLDLKGEEYCPACRAAASLQRPAPRSPGLLSTF
ncbi:MAG TPA: archaemetzincin family Zn-dependent metalloprotease [Candidatus Angelobacter sp.]|nr:archaemetzincin family Zn-dependent metalloprotease [Candidatus Angelobacter sp.]